VFAGDGSNVLGASCYKTISGIAAANNFRLHVRSLNIIQNVKAYFGDELYSVTTPSVKISDYEWIISISFTYTSGPVYFYVNNGVTTTANTVWVDWIYIGTGAYSTPIVDNSGNGLDLTAYGVTPDGNGNLIYDGVNDYLRTTNVLASVPDEMTFVFDFPNGHAQSAVRQDVVNYKIGSTTVGFLDITRILNTDTLRFQYCSGAAAPTIDFTSFFTGYSTTHLQVRVHLKWSTGAVDVSRNGVQFGAATMTTPVKPTAGSYLYFGSYLGTSYFLAGTMGQVRYYNRDLLDSEALSLYNDESFVTENNGLCGYWDVNYGLGINTVSVLGHNIKTGTEVKIQANNSNEWGDPPLDETLTVNSTTILKFLSSTYYYKYWKFYFGQGSTEIGRLWLGNYLTIDPSSLLDFNVTKKRSDIVIHGKNRQKWASEGIGWRRFELSFPRTEETMIYQLSEMIDYVGNHSSVIFSNFDTDYGYTLVTPCYVSIAEEIDFQHTNRMGWNYSIVLEEEK
jgi:hypothetical protein